MEIKDLLMVSPETGNALIPASEIIDNLDGSYSVVVADEKTGAKWKHTIKTEEV
ncbi:MAG: hypothetical protein JW908_00645 [Anaerolineales bacterium]|nr:hypothetical protein [Anaerolineales bacterium]